MLVVLLKFHVLKLNSYFFLENTPVLEWHQRHAIAIGTAKGLRFLHEECRGAPIIHRDVRPGNILLTHDFVPMASSLAHMFSFCSFFLFIKLKTRSVSRTLQLTKWCLLYSAR